MPIRAETPVTEPKNKKEVPVGKGCLAVVIAVPVLLLALGVYLLAWATGGGQELARLSLTDQPSEVEFQLPAETVVDVWADVDFRHTGISPSKSADELPHVLDYVIEISGGQAPNSKLRCDPFRSHIFRNSGEHSTMGQASGRHYDGKLNGCRFRLSAGDYTLRAHKETVRADQRFTFSRTDLILRGP